MTQTQPPARAGKKVNHSRALLRRTAVATVQAVPATWSALALLWLLRFASHSSAQQLRESFGASIFVAGEPWRVLTAGLTSGTFAAAVWSTAALLTLGVFSERVLGTSRFVAVAVSTHVVAVVVGVSAAWLVAQIGGLWGEQLSSQWMLTPTTWVFGTAACASAYMSALWRRRIRVVTVTIALTLFLYSGVLADFPRLVATVLGLVVGQWLVFHNFRRGAVSIRELRILLATAVFAVSTGPVIAATNPESAGPLSEIAAFVIQPQLTAEEVRYLCEIDPDSGACLHAIAQSQGAALGSFVANVLPLAIIAVFCYGLAQGRRLAWWVSLCAQVITVVALYLEMDVLRDTFEYRWVYVVSVLAVLVPWLGTIVTLFAFRRVFRVPTAPGAMGAFFSRVLGLLAVTGVMWVGGALLLRGHFKPEPSLLRVLVEWPLVYVPPVITQDVVLIPQDGWAAALTVWPGVLLWIGVTVALYVVLISVPNAARLKDQTAAREMLQSGSGDHISWMTLWAGNRYFFTPGGYVAYRVHNQVAVTVGEPVVTGGDAVDIARRFEAFAAQQGWRATWYSVREEFAAQRQVEGWNCVQVAEESVLSTEVAFTGKKFQDVRTARNRAAKEGITAVWTTWAECGAPLRERIVALSEDWVADKSLPEMGFTLGGLRELADEDVTLMVALDEAGHVHGVTSWLPVYEQGRVAGLMLDFMRRDAAGFRPVVEFLIAESVVKARELGIGWVSLSGAPLAHSDDSHGVLPSVLDAVGRSMEPLYGFRSLSFFKRKFQPEHHPWLLCYRDELSLPAIGVAVGKCYVPQVAPSQLLQAAKTLAQRGRRG